MQQYKNQVILDIWTEGVYTLQEQIKFLNFTLSGEVTKDFDEDPTLQPLDCQIELINDGKEYTRFKVYYNGRKNKIEKYICYEPDYIKIVE